MINQQKRYQFNYIKTKMSPPQPQPKSSSLLMSIINKLLLIFFLLYIIAIYLQAKFPQQLKHISPQVFQSHPVRDLTQQILSFSSIKSHLYNQKIIGQCEDVQVTSKGLAYCVNSRSEIIEINFNENTVKKVGEAQTGISYGSRLSRDQSKLYFTNSDLGICEYNISTHKTRSLISQYNHTHLHSLNSIQTHPTNPQILYITQSNPHIPMHLHTIDILLNNPLGRLFQFNITSGELTLLTDGLYFPNGVVYQVYRGEETVLVAETNRFRIVRVYLSGGKKGMRQVAIDRLDLFLDNMKANQNGDIWVAGPSMRDQLSHFADWHPIIRLIISRLPPQLFPLLANTPYFGGLKIKFTPQNETQSVEYYLWKSLPEFNFVTTVYQRHNKLFLSSLVSKGVMVVEDVENVQRIKEEKDAIQNTRDEEML